MRIIIAGTRRLWSLPAVRQAIVESGFDITFIIAGGAPGVDTAAADVAAIDGIPFKVYPANWDEYGRAAGGIRNREMKDANAEGLIALPDSESIGTRDMINVMRKVGLPVFVKELT